MIGLREASEQQLAELLATANQQSYSYPEVGATARELPNGYRHDRWSVDLGPDEDERFDRAADAVLSWACQHAAGIAIYPNEPPSAETTFLLLIRALGLVHIVASARVVYVINEDNRRGFAYGTLPGHPERGEESFIVARDGGRIRFDIVAFSRPRAPLARAGSPVTRFLQLRATRNYLAVVRRAAR